MTGASAEGMRAARRLAGWQIGDPSLANLIVEAYLDPERAHARLDADGAPARTGTYRSNLSE